MAAKWIDIVTGSLEQKKQYRRYKARIDGLPEPHRAVAEAHERYLLYCGVVQDGKLVLTMLDDFADLWEGAVADGTPVRQVVGDDPVEFAETFARSYAGRQWIDKERARLTRAVDEALRGERS